MKIAPPLVFLALTGCSAGASPSASTGSVPGAVAVSLPVGEQQLRFTTKDGTVVDYFLVVPKDRHVGTPGKVVFAFPPGGQDLNVTRSVVESRWREEALARDWVVASPAAPPTGLYYSDKPAALVSELLDAIAAQYPPEGGRFDLAGVSNGGLSAFRAAINFPDRFRSLVVFPGYSEAGGDDPELVKLKHIGVAMFVGGDDTGWLEPSRLTETTLKRLGYAVELHVVAGQAHIIATLTGKDLFDALERVRG